MDRRIYFWILYMCCAVAFISCSGDEGEYKVICNVEYGIRVDSIALFQYEDDYKAIRCSGYRKLNTSREVEFSGKVNKPKIAYIQLNGNSILSNRYYFILENSHVEIKIGNGHLKISGGDLTNQYFNIFAERRGIYNKRKSLRLKYIKLLADSLVNDSMDYEFKRINDQLSDSLQRLYRKSIMRSDLVSDIIWNQYGNEITMTDEMKKLTAKYQASYRSVK